MPSPNQIIIASAGSGKTTSIVSEAGNANDERCALITFTNNNTEELREKAHELFGHIPTGVTVSTWYRFLLRHFLRPYQRCLYEPRVDRLHWVQGRSPRFPGATHVAGHYFSSEGNIYSDKASKFACAIIQETDGLPICRFEQIFDHLYIDEVQDLSGWDLELVEYLLNSEVSVSLIGDIRQATFRTNAAAKNSQYAGPNIIRKFEEWCCAAHTTLRHDAHSYRCVQAICDFADSFYPDLPSTESRNETTTEHDGVFAVRSSDVDAYIERFDPQPLRLRRSQVELPGFPLNFGESKGKGFQRTLIFPHNNLVNVVKSGDVTDLGPSDETRAKVYVGITRAFQSVGIVIPDNLEPAGIPVYG